MITAVLSQTNFRGRTDTVALNSTTFDYALNTNWTQPIDENFRIRFAIAETAGGAINNVNFTLQSNLNGGGWVSVTNLTGVSFSLTPNFATNDPTTAVLGLSGTFVAGEAFEDETASGGISLSSNYTELEYSLQLHSLSSGDTVQFRILGNGAVLGTYAQTPTVTAYAPPVFTGTGAVSFSGIPSVSSTGTYTYVTPVTGDGAVSFSGTPSISSTGELSQLTQLLYVLPTAGSPNTNDSAFITLFGSSGYNVTQWSATGNIPTDMSPYDVVFISESCVSTDVAAKWNGVTQGVVIAENAAWDEMNLASSATTLTATTTLTVVSGHPIAAGYSGDTAILTSAAQMRIGDTLAASAINIAHQVGTSTNEVIFAYESGDTLLNAATAAGRRVAMGLHSDTMTLLSTAGEDILLAAVAWAASPGEFTGDGAVSISVTSTVSSTGTFVSPANSFVGNGAVSLSGTPTISGSATFTDPGNAYSATGAISLSGTPTVSSTGTFTSKSLLYVLPTADSPSAADSALITLFEGDGWTVNQWTAASNIPTDMSPYDVVFISETNLSADILAKWNNVTQGVVNAENGAWDEMLQADSSTAAYSSVTSVQITNSTHPIAAGYSGEVTVFSSAVQIRASTSNAATNGEPTEIAHVVGNSNNDWLWAHESGALMWDGTTTAAGRRVAIGLHNDTMTVLTTAGEDIVLATLNWAASFEAVAGGGEGAVSFSGTPTISGTGTLGTAAAIYTGTGTVTLSGTPTISSSGVSSKNLLYVLPTAGSPGTGDSAFITLFESDGWTVTQWSESSNIPNDMSLYDVVFISGATASVNVGSKYRTTTTGVVVGNNGSWDDMDLAIGSATIAAATQVTVYSGHPIAAGYSGTTTIFTSAAQMRWANPVGVTQTNGTLVVSRLNTIGEGMLFAYESGATMENSFVAPARRVGAGLHPDTMTVLATAGEEILLAALNWAASFDTVVGGGVGAVSFSGTPTISGSGTHELLNLDTIDVYVQVFKSDGTTSITNRVLFENIGINYTTLSSGFTVIGNPTKSEWENALLKIEFIYTTNDGTNERVRLTTVDLEGTYSTESYTSTGNVTLGSYTIGGSGTLTIVGKLNNVSTITNVSNITF